ncbi:unnamed protein product, partial [Cyprideis torosa]
PAGRSALTAQVQSKPGNEAVFNKTEESDLGVAESDILNRVAQPSRILLVSLLACSAEVLREEAHKQLKSNHIVGTKPSSTKLSLAGRSIYAAQVKSHPGNEAIFNQTEEPDLSVI